MQTAASVASVQLLIQPDRDPITRSGAEITMKPERRGTREEPLERRRTKLRMMNWLPPVGGGGCYKINGLAIYAESQSVVSPRLLTWVVHHGNADCVGNFENLPG